MNKSRIALKSLAVLLALCLIGGIFYFTNAFMGNPITAALANHATKAYVTKEYPSLNLEVGKSCYDLKSGRYTTRVSSPTNIDTHFDVYYRDGEVKGDDYQTCILMKANTLDRLEKDYSELIQPILAKITGLENNRSKVMFEKSEYEEPNEAIKLDMPFDRTLPLDMEVNIRQDLSDISLGYIAHILEEAHQELLNNNCVFTSYGLTTDSDGVCVMIMGVTPIDIEGGQLESLLQAAQYNRENRPESSDIAKDEEIKDTPGEFVEDDQDPGASGITVFIKDSKEDQEKSN